MSEFPTPNYYKKQRLPWIALADSISFWISMIRQLPYSAPIGIVYHMTPENFQKGAIWFDHAWGLTIEPPLAAEQSWYRIEYRSIYIYVCSINLWGKCGFHIPVLYMIPTIATAIIGSLRESDGWIVYNIEELI